MQGIQQPTTVKSAMEAIGNRDYLLPAIQRRFVWSSEKVEALFDSLMQGYPINSFMFWRITESTVKKSVRFYDFLQNFREHFKERNAEFSTHGHKDFFAVIDGQQRLTALYIGLLGSYAYKLPRVWWRDTEESLPTRHLYLNIYVRRSKDDELGMEYDFRFMTKAEVQTKGEQWFRVGEALDFDTDEAVDDYIEQHGIEDREAKRALRRLRKVVHEDRSVLYYVETSQDIDKVLDIFIRTNSGGVPLSYSDLLMSYTTAQWRDRDAREEIDNLVARVFKVGTHGFMISKDFVLKTALMLFANDVRFRLKNLTADVIGELEKNWDAVAASILAAFEFLADIGFHELNLRTKNAVIRTNWLIFAS